jgi:hypothetical protein
MSVQTSDGRWSTLPCKVKRQGPYQAKITADYNSTGVPITKAVITSNGVPIYKGVYKSGPKLYANGPVELGGEF